ncbi:DUF3298 domain-containing protein [Olivibacter sp. SDN3]|uniref:DUF3298 and DUF4163 domain-containing protein n=1 Tax=Olivibacter sp. SDN3 TaxID=2764720 RepID=UPI001650FD00|nr:DUF3298 and DUF4163 domain-containing protein [Olivibacter sp. SDN3]QNL49890.1 DUF3298 domain-containing protein [Olivibacter sp. SDN3]
MKVLYLIFFFAFIIITACETRPGSDAGSSGVDTLQYSYQTYSLQSKHLIDNEEKKDTTYFNAAYPRFEDQAIQGLVARNITSNNNPDSTYDSLEEEAEAFISNFDDFIEMDEYPRAWFTDIQAKVIQNTPNYLALCIDHSEYTGGAHGNYATLFFNYDLSRRDTLGLGEVIPTEHWETLDSIAEVIFREQENLSTSQDLSDAYFFEDNTFHLNTNFTLNSKGLLFLYNVYEIKPYAAGTTELLIPYPSIEQLMTEKGKKIRAELK